MTREFLGIPVKGDIQPSYKHTPQRPLSELTPLMQAVVDDPAVGTFGWSQWTPFFNDGEPCVFSVHSLWADPPGVTDGQGEDEPDDDYDRRMDRRYGFVVSDERWGRQVRAVYNGPWTYEGDCEETWRRLTALSEAMDSGAFDNVLLENFGDHAKVTVTKECISIEEYEHD